MIEIICNEENSDKSKQVTRGAAIRRPKNIKQIGEVSSDKKIYIAVSYTHLTLPTT